jgi:hypothetical protein
LKYIYYLIEYTYLIMKKSDDYISTILSLAFLLGVGYWLFYYHPDHTTRIGILSYKPDLGYIFKKGSSTVEWCKKCSGDEIGLSNLMTSDDADFWIPNYGYAWDYHKNYQPLPTKEIESVHWVKDFERPDHKNIVSSEEVGKWLPKDGYSWKNNDNRWGERVTWSPGLNSRERPHYLASIREGYWDLALGYSEVDGESGIKVAKWTAGLSYGSFKCLVSSDKENQWNIIDGHHLETSSDGNYKIVADSKETDWGSVVTKGIFSALLYSISKPSPDDGVVAGTTKKFGTEMANETVKSAVRDVFNPNGSNPCHNANVPSELHKV